MLEILEIIKWGGYPLAIAAFFYVYFVMRPKWIRQGANDFKRKLQADDIKIIKQGKRIEKEIEQMNNDDIWDYITSNSN